MYNASGVNVGVGVCVEVSVGVCVIVGVIVGVCVGVCDGVIDGAGGNKQFKQSKFNKSYLSSKILKLCLIIEASNGSVYILNALKSPIKLPPKISSK